MTRKIHGPWHLIVEKNGRKPNSNSNCLIQLSSTHDVDTVPISYFLVNGHKKAHDEASS